MPKHSALNYGLYLLGRRGRSQFELKTKLLEKGYDAEEVTAVITRLVGMKLLDDQQFAASYARDKVSIYRRGRYRIGLELSRKGVKKEVIDDTLAQVEETDELAAAISLLKGRERAWQNLDERKRYQRSVQLLGRRGFSGKIIRQAMTNSEPEK